ncbi:MAG: hypothetical protein E3K37_16010 [Candidatus Kuenenia sp.]|nr:hypothetical protein [Candidatus Kuenenia hertensis]
MKQKKFKLHFFLPVIFITSLPYFAGCSSTHSKEHIDTIKTDLNSLHKDVDKVLGLDKPSSLIEE